MRKHSIKLIIFIIIVFLTNFFSGIAYAKLKQNFPVDQTKESKLRKEALEILSKYGGHDRQLNKVEMRNFLADMMFKKIDSDSDGAIQITEFIDALLYCKQVNKKWECDANTVDGENPAYELFSDQRKMTKEKKLTSIELYRLNDFWRLKIDAMVNAHWDRACSGTYNESLDVTELIHYLGSEESRRFNRRLAKIREDKLLELLQNDKTNATEEEFGQFMKGEIFEETDTDDSNSVDILEVKTKFKSPEVIKDLIKINKGDSIFMDKSKFQTINSDTTLSFIVSKLVTDEWEVLNGDQYKLTSAIVKRFKEQEKDTIKKAQKEKGTKLLGLTWLKDIGFVICGDYLYDKEEEKESLNWKKSILTMRVIKDFTKASDKAEPAKFHWTKESGESSVANVDMALRFDYYSPTWYNNTNLSFRPAFGVQFIRSGEGDKEVNNDKIYLLGDLFVNHGWSILRSSQFNIGPVLDYDNKNDVDKVTGLLEWEPRLNISGFPTGVRYPLNKTRSLSFYVRPLIALEFDNIIDKPHGEEISNTTYFRYGMQTGFKILKRVEITYSVKQWHEIDDFNKDFFYQEANLHWSPYSDEWVSIEIGYKKGNQSVGSNKIEEYSAGLGIKF